jgi:AbrB family looped-hinge helix DNA binding protein
LSGKKGKIFGMSTTTLSTKGQLVIPSRFRKALHLQPGDKVALALEGETLILRRLQSRQARLVEQNGRKVLVAAPDAPPMTTELVKALLADFP